MPLAGCLIAQQRENAAALHDVLNIGPAAFFGQHVLTRPAAEMVHEVVEIRVIERPSDRERRKAEQAHHVARKFEVAKVTRDQDEWPAAKERADERFLIDNVGVVFPVGLVNLARSLGDFNDHQH